MRIVFMGTPSFAAQALAALIPLPSMQVVAVYTQPPRPANRGKKVQKTAVHQLAEHNNLDVHTPLNFKNSEDLERFDAHKADVAIVAAYGLLLPSGILDAPRHGCVNIHASLLPRWRGAAPIHRAIQAGDGQTGITLMQMDRGLDTGDIIRVKSTAIEPDHTTPVLHDALAGMGAEMLGELLGEFPNGDWPKMPQPSQGVTYASKITKAEARLDWSKSAHALERQVRAFAPFPGSFLELPESGERLKVLAASAENVATPASASQPRGTVSTPLVIQCAQGALAVTRAQRAGKSAMDIDELMRGLTIPPNAILE